MDAISRTAWIVGALALALAEGACAQVVRYVHTDALGTPVAMTDESGVVISRRVYHPYGEQVSGEEIDGPGYTGHVNDGETDLTYMQQRYYDPELAIFLSVDHVAAVNEGVLIFNRYRYANGNPYKYMDFDGRLGCTGSRIRAVCDSGVASGVRTSIRSPVDKPESGVPRSPVPNSVPVDYKDSGKGSEAVQAIKLVGIVDALKSKSLAGDAKKEAAASGLPGLHNGKGDAFRHCVWSCGMAREVGVDSAKKVGDNHEVWVGGAPGESKMDLYNNEVGRSLINSPQSCSAGCMKAVGDGTLSVDVEEWR